MDLSFTCPNCKQELVAESKGAGSEIECPSCSNMLTIPDAIPQNVLPHSSSESDATPKDEKHWSVPQHDGPVESLIIEEALPSLEVSAKDTEKKIRVKTIRHSDCVEVGHDKFDEIAGDILEKIGHENTLHVHPFNYDHLDLATRQMVSDYGLMIIYRG